MVVALSSVDVAKMHCVWETEAAWCVNHSLLDLPVELYVVLATFR